MTITGASVVNNHADIEGGGIWSNGTLNMQGTVTVQNNIKTGGLASNVFLKSGHVITVTGSLGSSSMGLTVEGNNGVVTSGYASNNSTTNHFSNDRSAIADLNLVGGEAKITPKGGIYYVERAWDEANQKVTETLRLRPWGTSYRLNGTSTNDATTLEDGTWYTVESDVIYGNVEVAENAHAHLILCDGQTLTAPIYLKSGSTLSIYGQLYGTGAIVANKERDYSGIGSNSDNIATTLNIHGGTITAEGGTHSAGIGGGFPHDGITLNIYGGHVKATGTVAAGIGSGSHAIMGGSPLNGGIITIYGGYVEAHGGDTAAGIGGGSGCNGGTITIKGGTVYAYGGNDGAGIGSGQDYYGNGVHGGTITITGGYVYAKGDDVAAGIGAGEDADMGIITITGGIVEAHGGGGEEWAHAIATDDDNEGVNSVTLGDNMMVSSERDFTAGERYVAIRDR